MLDAVAFLIDTQIWWTAFERRDSTNWNFFSFLLYLLMPITAFLLCYPVLPDLREDDLGIDLARNFPQNRPWFFGLLALLPCASLVEEALCSGLPRGEDAVFRVVFAGMALLASRIESSRFQLWNALVALALICGYIAVLFRRLH